MSTDHKEPKRENAGSPILVVGAGGFIGRNLLRVLLRQGRHVLALTRSGNIAWPGGPPPPEDLRRLKIIAGDLSSSEEWIDAVAEAAPAKAIFLAWSLSPDVYTLVDVNLSSLQANLHGIERISQVGCDHFIVTGTGLEYAPKRDLLCESDAIAISTPYTACKHALHSLAATYLENQNAKLTWLRLFYLYGPYESPRRLMPWIVSRLLEDQEVPLTAGRQVHDYLHVADVAAAIDKVVDSDATGVFNICSGQPTSVRQIANFIGAKLEKPELLKFGAIPDRQADPAWIVGDPRLFADRFDWQPSYDLESGLEDAIDWWIGLR